MEYMFTWGYRFSTPKESPDQLITAVAISGAKAVDVIIEYSFSH